MKIAWTDATRVGPNLEFGLAVQDDDNLVVMCLSVQDVLASARDPDVCGEKLAIAEELPLYGGTRCRRIDLHGTNHLAHPLCEGFRRSSRGDEQRASRGRAPCVREIDEFRWPLDDEEVFGVGGHADDFRHLGLAVVHVQRIEPDGAPTVARIARVDRLADDGIPERPAKSFVANTQRRLASAKSYTSSVA